MACTSSVGYNGAMIAIGLIGLGRIGQLHADNLRAHPQFELRAVFDVNARVCGDTARRLGVAAAKSISAMMEDDTLAAVMIASPTATHCDLIEQATQAGKAVLCEKPLDLDMARVQQCEQRRAAGVFVQLGFNRRFDPGHAAVLSRAAAGEVGRVEKVVITSRDPGLPSAEYLAASGGLFRDMMIHDFDMARAALGSEPVRVLAVGAALAAPQVCEAVGDVDTAMAILQTERGALCHINCARRAVYGYDQRLEIVGSDGMLLSDNRTRTQAQLYNAEMTGAREPLLHFFTERYADSYRLQLDAFAVQAADAPSFADGVAALRLANAADESARSGQWVSVDIKTA